MPSEPRNVPAAFTSEMVRVEGISLVLYVAAFDERVALVADVLARTRSLLAFVAFSTESSERETG